jgi:heptosyltransferase-1
MSDTLLVRLGAMGDIIHTLPAAARLGRVTWLVEPKWTALLEGNPHVESVITLDRRKFDSVAAAWRELRRRRFRLAVDFQGLLKSAITARASGASMVLGYENPREILARIFYSRSVPAHAAHIVDQHLELAAAAGAASGAVEFPIPPGAPEGDLPGGDFVLASPLAGWNSKQWPIEYYSELARHFKLVVNGPPAARDTLALIAGAHVHTSGIPGLIDATRRARAVIGVDSGPLHLAAALGKPGVAIFGPTDPARNGPYGGSMRVLRAPGADTTYKRGAFVDPSMRAITPQQVLEALA